MSVETISSEPYFFGKDTFVPFIGQVEDVDDPKRSNRVKVRCTGWHPTDKNELSTEDLPWAKVCMPTTHAQQAGIGGKHGLLPGCFVIGFFMDGLDAQDPYILTTFNFTSKVVKENNREVVDSSDGKLPENVPGIKKTLVGSELYPNKTRATENEQNAKVPTDTTDAARDSVLDSSTGGPCDTTRPASDKTRLKEDKTTENPESHKYKLGLADGVCGPLAGAREEIQNIMSVLFPSDSSRFAYGDVVWNAFTGNYVDMNGVLLLISKFICSQLKLSINTMKAFTEDKIMRPKKGAILLAIPDRDGILREAADFATSVASDNFNAAIDLIVSKLCDLVLSTLQKLNNGSEEDNRQQSDEESGGDNRNNRDSKGNVGAKSTTPIKYSNSISLTDEILKTVSLEVDSAIEKESQKALQDQDKIQSDLEQMSEDIKDTDTSANTCNPENAIKMAEMNLSLNEMKNENNSSSSESGDIGSMLGDAAKYLQMLLELKFILNPTIHNKSGLGVLDQINSALECVTSEARMFETAIGKLGSIAGVDFRNAVTGGGSYSGKSSKITKNIQRNIGFGGLPITDSIKRPGEPLILSDDSKTSRVNNKSSRREEQPEWGSVEFHDINRSYTLRGEVTFGQRTTNNSRILVSNQGDPTENGIYETSSKDWVRVDDASKPKDFKTYKLISIQGRVERTERWWFYNGTNNPKLGSNPINFEPLYVTPGYRPVKKVGDIIKNTKLESLKEIVDDISIDKLTGENSYVLAVSVPSGDIAAAKNFVSGIPNQLVVTDPGFGYYNENYQDGDFEIRPKSGAPSESGANIFPNNTNSFPSIYIPRYEGTPIPVLDPKTGEIVSILTNFNSFNEGSSTVSVIKDNSNIGILSNDPRYDITIGGFFIQNIGQNYTEDTRLEVIDRDTNEENGQIKPVLVEGRIVDVEIINNGTGFKRIPQILIIDTLGAGAKIFPIMSVVARNPNSPSVKPISESVNMIFCNTKNQKNLIKPGSQYGS